MASNSVNLTTPNGLVSSVVLSVNADVSGSTISASASINCGGTYWYQGMGTLQLIIDGELVKSEDAPCPSKNYTYTVSGSSDVSDGNHTITANWINTTPHPYVPTNASVSTSVNVSTYTSGSISINKASASIDESIGITLSSGNHNSITSLRWSCNGQSGSLSASSQTWNLSSLESVLNNVTSATCTLTATQSVGGDLSRSFTVTVPERYKPTITFKNVVGYNLQNNYLIAGTSYFDINYTTGLTPSNNTAYISSIEVIGSYNPSTVGTPTFTKGTNKVTSNVLPVYSNVSTYKISATIKVTDSRGRYATIQVTEAMIGTVYNYIPPAITGFNVYRCDSSGVPRPSGMYGYAEVNISPNTDLTILKLTVNNVDYSLNYVDNNKYNVIFGNNTLDIGTQYKVILSVQNTKMQSYGDVIQQIALLPTMQMPISLFDDGSQVSVSIGEMAFHYSGVSDSTSILNLAANSSIRVTNSSGTTRIIKSYDLVTKCPFPVNSIYLSVTSTNPSSLWEGTTWEQIAQGRTLIGQGSGTDTNGISKSFNNGSTGGEYSHALTVQEMPSHNHMQQTSNWIKRGVIDGEKGVGDNTSGFNDPCYTQNTGGDGYHNNIQPYLVVYIWKRTA